VIIGEGAQTKSGISAIRYHWK